MDKTTLKAIHLALRIMRARAAAALRDANKSTSELFKTDATCSAFTYSACADILAEALAGRIDVVAQFAGGLELAPCDAALLRCPCDTCTNSDACDLSPIGPYGCPDWAAWNDRN